MPITLVRDPPPRQIKNHVAITLEGLQAPPGDQHLPADHV